jgi:CheY-like chemotaxis protein
MRTIVSQKHDFMEISSCMVESISEITFAAPSWKASTFLAKPLGQVVPSVVYARNGIPMKDTRLLISVVDDDESVRESLPDLLNELGFKARAFSSAEEFLKSDTVLQSGCLILDLAMPGMTGSDLQRELKRRQIQTPIIFITGHQDEAVRRETINQGAVACLLKPFTDSALLNALNAALRDK